MRKPTMLEKCGITKPDDSASWDELVEMLLGPVPVTDGLEQRQHRKDNALRIAAAALRAAGKYKIVEA